MTVNFCCVSWEAQLPTTYVACKLFRMIKTHCNTFIGAHGRDDGKGFQGLQVCMHPCAQVHMDVKTPNVLLGRTYIAKLADVGLAKFLHKDYLSAAKSVGTFAWSVRDPPSSWLWPVLSVLTLKNTVAISFLY